MFGGGACGFDSPHPVRNPTDAARRAHEIARRELEAEIIRAFVLEPAINTAFNLQLMIGSDKPPD
jgi:hypothetical protein